MPYNPQISYHGDQAILQGRQNLMNAVLMLAGGLGEQARQREDALNLLKQVDPSNFEQYKKLTLGELQGTIKGLEYKQKVDAAKVLQEYHAAQTGQMKAETARLTGQQEAESAMGRAMQAAMPQTRTVTAEQQGPVLPGQTLSPLSMQVQDQPAPGAIVRAMMTPENRASINSRAGEWAVREYFQRYGAGMANDQGLIPFTLGTGDNALSGGIETRTGKTFLDPETQGRLEAARVKARHGPIQATPVSGGPTVSKDGKFYWDDHLHAWKPLAKQGTWQNMSLFPDQGGQQTGQPIQSDPLGLFRK